MATKPDGIASRTRSRTLTAIETVVSPVSQHKVSKTSSRSKKSNKATVENANAVKCSHEKLPSTKSDQKEKTSKLPALIYLNKCPEVNIVPLITRDSSAYKTEAIICPVCLLELLATRKPTATICGHIFCADCIERAIRKWKTCPSCKANITLQSCFRLHLVVK